MASLPPQALLEGLRRFDFAPEELISLASSNAADDRQLLHKLLGPVRSDLAMREEALARGALAGPPLPLALHAFGGEADRSVGLASLERWAQCVVGEPSARCHPSDSGPSELSGDGDELTQEEERGFSARVLPGGHFYLAEADATRDALLELLGARCAAALRAAPPSLVAGPPLPPVTAYVHEMVEAAAAETPDAPALLAEGRTYTFAEAVGAARLLSNWLVAHGARSGKVSHLRPPPPLPHLLSSPPRLASSPLPPPFHTHASCLAHF